MNCPAEARQNVQLPSISSICHADYIYNVNLDIYINGITERKKLQVEAGLAQ